MPDWEQIIALVQTATGEPLVMDTVQPVGGGCINAAYRVGAGPRQLFIKINQASAVEMFEAETEGLLEMARSNSMRVPKPVCCGVAGEDAYLVMEYIALAGSGDTERLGEDLAALHHANQPRSPSADHPRYGWRRDNTIGSTPQINTWSDDWVAFWAEHRLGYQLALAARQGAGHHLVQRGERLMESLPHFFTDYRPAPSLLHGDLWSGNMAYDESGRPVIFDPAVYYGDREADLAMTELFGGFPAKFYAAYNAAWPLDAGYPVRKILYNLYHILNHFNLFGGGYLAQAEAMVDRLLSECR